MNLDCQKARSVEILLVKILFYFNFLIWNKEVQKRTFFLIMKIAPGFFEVEASMSRMRWPNQKENSDWIKWEGTRNLMWSLRYSRKSCAKRLLASFLERIRSFRAHFIRLNFGLACLKLSFFCFEIVTWLKIFSLDLWSFYLGNRFLNISLILKSLSLLYNFFFLWKTQLVRTLLTFQLLSHFNLLFLGF